MSVIVEFTHVLVCLTFVTPLHYIALCFRYLYCLTLWRVSSVRVLCVSDKDPLSKPFVTSGRKPLYTEHTALFFRSLFELD